MTAIPQPDALSPVRVAASATMPMKYAGFLRRSMAALIDILILLVLMIGAAVALAPSVSQTNDIVTIAKGGQTIRLSDLAAPRIVVNRTGSETTITETTTATVGLQTIHHVVTRTTNERSGASRQPTWTSSSLSVYPSAMAIILFVGLWLLYASAFEASGMQATPGKLALFIRVADEQGRRVTMPRALARNGLKLVSALPVLVGFMMAGWTARKQALHDMMAQCVVELALT
jgi:uncharacterized RDD family membrane protein YckC